MTVRGRNGRTAELVPVATAVTSPALADVHAAGALVWRLRRRRLEVCLIHRPRYRDWSWPKGKLDPGESCAAAAVREVAEETGTAVVLGVPLPALRYRTPDGGRKHVRYWAARAATDDDAAPLAARAPVERAALTEIDDVVWVSAPTARDLLTRPTDRRPLDVVAGLHEEVADGQQFGVRLVETIGRLVQGSPLGLVLPHDRHAGQDRLGPEGIVGRPRNPLAAGNLLLQLRDIGRVRRRLLEQLRDGDLRCDAKSHRSPCRSVGLIGITGGLQTGRPAPR